MFHNIGIMLGCYIITKMTSFAFKKNETNMVRALSIMTILVTIVCIIGLLLNDVISIPYTIDLTLNK